MCVKCWLQKLDLQIWKNLTCLGFLNSEEFYQGWNFGCFWWNILSINLICCIYQNLCMTFTNVFGFLLNFSVPWKSCVKEQWPKNHFFNFFDLTSWLVTQGQTEGWIYLSPWNHARWQSPQRKTKLNLFSVLDEQIKSLKSKQSKFNFWNRLNPKFAFLWHLLTQTATWRPNHLIWTSSVTLILKAMADTVFLGPRLGVVKKNLFTLGGFFNEI